MTVSTILSYAFLLKRYRLYFLIFCGVFLSSLTCHIWAKGCPVHTSLQGLWHVLKTPMECALAHKILQWKALEEDGVSFEDITDFYHANPSWPNQVALKRKAEMAITENTSLQKIMAWFKKNPPVTGAGLIAFARLPHTPTMIKQWQDVFPKVTLSKHELSTLMKNATHLLQQKDLINRFDLLMKTEQLESASHMLPFLPKAYGPVAKERLALAHGHTQQRKNFLLPGYLWQYALSLLKQEKNQALLSFLNEKTVISAEVLDPDIWWTSIRRILVRRFIDQGLYREAYAVASGSKNLKGTEFAEAKWLEGWINLTFLKRPKDALITFQTLYDHGETALNLSKASYWAARAANLQGNKSLQKIWLEKAAKHRANFYGQLASDALEQPFPPEDLIVSRAEDKAFEQMELVRVIRLLKKVNNIELSELFFWKLAINVSRPDEHELLIKLASEVAGPHAAVQVTKIGSKHVMPAIEEAYPHIEKSQMPVLTHAFGINMQALIHAIIRQESRFKLQATSHKGAKGLMQILDGTAKHIAKSDNIPYQNIYDPKSNIALGEAYLKKFLQRYNGSLILTLAAYNAGPNRVDRWITQYGKPGDKNGFEAVEWIQMIPFRETRHYVERVLENYWRYCVSFDGIPIKSWHEILF